MINHWANEILRIAPAPPAMKKDVALMDVASTGDTGLFSEVRLMLVQSLLRQFPVFSLS